MINYSSVIESFLCYSFYTWSLIFRLEHDGPDGSLPCWLRVRKFALGSPLVQPERVWFVFVPGIYKHLAPVSQCPVPARSLATEAAPRAEPPVKLCSIRRLEANRRLLETTSGSSGHLDKCVQFILNKDIVVQETAGPPVTPPPV